MIPLAVINQVKERAGYRCELCNIQLGQGLLVECLDGDIGNIAEDNLIAFCFRCATKRRHMIPPPDTREKVFRKMAAAGVGVQLSFSNVY